MPRGRSVFAFTTLLTLLAATLLSGCLGGDQPPQLAGGAEPCGSDFTPPGRLIIAGTMNDRHLNERPGGLFSLNIEAVNEGDCVVSFRTQPIVFTFKREDTGEVVKEERNFTNVTLPGGVRPVEGIRPSEGAQLDNFALYAPEEPGFYVIEVRLERLGWEGRQALNVAADHASD